MQNIKKYFIIGLIFFSDSTIAADLGMNLSGTDASNNVGITAEQARVNHKLSVVGQEFENLLQDALISRKESERAGIEILGQLICVIVMVDGCSGYNKLEGKRYEALLHILIPLLFAARFIHPSDRSFVVLQKLKNLALSLSPEHKNEVAPLFQQNVELLKKKLANDKDGKCFSACRALENLYIAGYAIDDFTNPNCSYDFRSIRLMTAVLCIYNLFNTLFNSTNSQKDAIVKELEAIFESKK